MISPKDTIYPRFKKNISKKELNILYTPTSDEISLAQRKRQGRSKKTGNYNHLYFLVMLKTYQRLGYFVLLNDVPYKIIKHIALKIQINTVPKELTAFDQSGARQRHVNTIRKYLNVTEFDVDSEIIMDRAIADVARVREDLADIINVAIEELIHHKHELPSFGTIQRAALKGRSDANQNIYNTLSNSIDSASRDKIKNLFDVKDEMSHSPWNKIKSEPGKLSRNNLRERITYYEWLIQYSVGKEALLYIPEAKINKFFAEANSLDAARMLDLAPNKMYALFIAFISKKISSTLDDFGDMLIKQISKIHTNGKSFLVDHQDQNRDSVDELIDILHKLLIARKDGNSSSERDMYEASIISGREDQFIKRCEDHSIYSGNNYFPFLWEAHSPYRSAMFNILKSIELGSSIQDNALLDIITFLKKNQGSWKEYINIAGDKSDDNKHGFDLSWISDRWWGFIFEEPRGETFPETANRRNFELCVFHYLKEGLKSGDLFIKNSDKYSDYRTQLISWEEYHQLIRQYGVQVGLPVEGIAFVKHIQEWIDKIAKKVNRSFPKNEYANILNGEIFVKKSPKKKDPDGLDRLESLIAERLEPVSILDVLAYTQKWLEWDKSFGPLSGHDTKLENPSKSNIYTTFCYGCGLGPSQSERSIKEVNRRHLAWINQRHVTEEKLNDANSKIINAYNLFELIKLWGSGKSASADGTKWELYEQNLLSEYHIRYNGYGGIGYYHVSDTYIALFSNFIPCGVHEGTHILDIFKDGMDMKPDTLHGDTHAQSEVIFGLSYLLGIKLMPRIKNWKHLTFYRSNGKDTYSNIDEVFSDECDLDLIIKHLPDMYRVALSIKEGRITASAILRRLGTYSRKNMLFKAFRELGRLVRTGFLLEYLGDKDLRELIQAATCKSESYNGFTKWASFGNYGISTENNRDEQRKMIKYNHLVANCVCFYNVAAINQILIELINEGVPFNKDALSAISPYITKHINRFGEYTLDLEKQIWELIYQMPLAN